MPARQIARRADDFSRKLSFTSYASRAFLRLLRDAASACQRHASRKTTGESPSSGMRGTGLRRSARRRGDTGSPRTAGMRNVASSERHSSKTPPISVQSFTLIPFSAPIIPSRFAPRSPVMRHYQSPCLHYNKRHGQILSMPQNIFDRVFPLPSQRQNDKIQELWGMPFTEELLQMWNTKQLRKLPPLK